MIDEAVLKKQEKTMGGNNIEIVNLCEEKEQEYP